MINIFLTDLLSARNSEMINETPLSCYVFGSKKKTEIKKKPWQCNSSFFGSLDRVFRFILTQLSDTLVR